MDKIIKTAIAGYGVVGKKRHFFLKKIKNLKWLLFVKKIFHKKKN